MLPLCIKSTFDRLYIGLDNNCVKCCYFRTHLNVTRMSWVRTLWQTESQPTAYVNGEDLSDDESSSALLAAHREKENSFRLTLAQTSEYASSELYRDNFEIQKRISRTFEHKKKVHMSERCDDNSIRPKIRLETLSSTLATSIVWIAYFAFVFALLLPYFRSEGYLLEVRCCYLASNYCINKTASFLVDDSAPR